MGYDDVARPSYCNSSHPVHTRQYLPHRLGESEEVLAVRAAGAAGGGNLACDVLRGGGAQVVLIGSQVGGGYVDQGGGDDRENILRGRKDRHPLPDVVLLLPPLQVLGISGSSNAGGWLYEHIRVQRLRSEVGVNKGLQGDKGPQFSLAMAG